jgi:hypothetical protein
MHVLDILEPIHMMMRRFTQMTHITNLGVLALTSRPINLRW